MAHLHARQTSVVGIPSLGKLPVSLNTGKESPRVVRLGETDQVDFVKWVPEGGNNNFAVGRFWGHSRHWSAQHVSQGLPPKDTKEQ